MGLDMYLKKVKRIEGMTLEEYDRIADAMPWQPADYDENAGLQAVSDHPQAMKLNDQVRVIGEEGRFQYLSIYEEVGYWRKSNQIHTWFVQNVQNGVDECEPHEVTKEKLEELLEVCKKVVTSKQGKKTAKELLPSRAGFFFGGTEYDEWYYKDIEATIDIIEKALEETDFDNELVFYRSSW